MGYDDAKDEFYFFKSRAFIFKSIYILYYTKVLIFTSWFSVIIFDYK